MKTSGSWLASSFSVTRRRVRRQSADWANLTTSEEPVAAELFRWATVPYGEDGRLVRGVMVHCGSPTCDVDGGRVVPLPVPRQKSGLDAKDDIFIKQKLEVQGWRIGKTPDEHRCPQCYAAAKAKADSKAREKETLRIVVPAPIKSFQEIPRKMGREDRRIIFEKLNDVYVSEAVGYRNGWTDGKVATDLGVPCDWIKLIRDENFGEERLNGEIHVAIREAKALVAEVRATMPMAKEVTATLNRLIGLADKIEKSISEIEKVAG